jgi:hypothetical protein
LEEEILEPFNILIQEQDSLTNEYNAKYKELDRKMKKQMEVYNEAKVQHDRALKRAEDILYECEKYRQEDNTLMISKLNPKMTITLKEHEDTVQALNLIPDKILTEKNQYTTMMTTIMEALKQQEITRTEFAKTSLKKMLEYERARAAVHKQDADKTAEIIERVRAKSDIQKLIEILPIDKSELEIDLSKGKTGWDRLYELYRECYYKSGSKVLDYVALIEETKRLILQSTDPEYKQYRAELDKLCPEILKPQYGSLIKLIDSFKTQNKEEKGRIAFIDSLRNAIEARGNKNVTDRESRPIKEVFNDFVNLVI